MRTENDAYDDFACGHFDAGPDHDCLRWEDIFGGQPKDVAIQPCYYCGGPTALFSPHAVRKHIEGEQIGILECLCKENS